MGMRTDNFDPGCLSADTAGRAIMAADYLIESKLSADMALTRAQLSMETAALPTAAAGRGAVLGTGAECLAAASVIPGMTVDVATGGTVISHRGRKSTVAPAAGIVIGGSDIANPRWDILVATEAGALAVRAGAAAGAPVDPALTAGDTPLARVIVPAGALSIADGLLGTGWVVDLRNRYALQEPATPGLSIGLPGGSTDISGAGINADLQITLNGVPTILTIVDPNAFSIGGAAAVPLNNAASIVAALQQLADQASLAVIVSYDLAATRYRVTSVLRGRGQTVTVQDGLVNNLADNLLLGTANGGEEHAGILGQANEESFLLSNPAPRSVDGAALATGALAASAAGLAKMADGYLADSDAARAKMAAGFFEQNNLLSLAHFQDSFFGGAQVIGSAAGVKFATGAKPLVMNGTPQQNRLFLATLPTAGDWISIEGTDAVVVPYEFRADTPPTGGTAGRIWIYRGVDAAAARVNLVDAINAVVDLARIARGAVADVAGFVARDAVVQTSVMLMEITGSETTRNVTENLTDIADIWDQATTVSGMLETRQHFGIKQLTLNANHVAAGEVIFAMGFQPTWAIVINHNRPQNEAWAIIAATNAVALALAGGISPNNQAADVVTCIAGG